MKKKILRIIIFSVVLLIAFGCLVWTAQKDSNNDQRQQEVVDEQDIREELPWENGGKLPEEYTWDEFNELTAFQQMEFQYSFESEESFGTWMNDAQEEEIEEMPWDDGGKKPNEYTWEEFNALTGAQQIAFQRSFESVELFEHWMMKSQGYEELPWESGGKSPSEYTWDEFNSLNEYQQMEFQKAFEDENEFQMWMDTVNP